MSNPTKQILRGGSWSYASRDCRPIRRDRFLSEVPSIRIGFRVIKRFAKENNRVLRGGAWSSDVRTLRAAYRRHYSPDFRFGYFGFRVIKKTKESERERKA